MMTQAGHGGAAKELADNIHPSYYLRGKVLLRGRGLRNSDKADSRDGTGWDESGRSDIMYALRCPLEQEAEADSQLGPRPLPAC
jgi:hypothetical protein